MGQGAVGASAKRETQSGAQRHGDHQSSVTFNGPPRWALGGMQVSLNTAPGAAGGAGAGPGLPGGAGRGRGLSCTCRSAQSC